MRDAVLSAAVTGRLVPQDPADTSATELLAGLGVEPIEPPDGVPGLPDGWAWVPLGSVAVVSLGKMLDAKAQTGRHPERYLRNVNVRWGSFDLDDIAVMDIEPHQLERVTVCAGDLVVCEGGVPGRCAVWRGEPVAIQKALHRVRPTAGSLSAYLALVLAWWASRQDFARYTTGTTIKHIPKEKLTILPVPLPPLAEQARIVAEVDRQLSDLRACEQSIEAGLERSAALRRAVLKAAFAGQLVPQDPTDEPASVLLERIRAEREAAPKAKKPRRPRRAAAHERPGAVLRRGVPSCGPFRDAGRPDAAHPGVSAGPVSSHRGWCGRVRGRVGTTAGGVGWPRSDVTPLS